MSVDPIRRELVRAVNLLHAGRLLGIPTETVYGLAADASNPRALAKIFSAKGRPADHPLIVHLAHARAMNDWARDVPPAAQVLAAAFWPGPLTLILKRQAHVHDLITGGQDTIGLRVPQHALTLSLLHEFSMQKLGPAGLAAPSANRYGRISPTCAEDVRSELGEHVAQVLDGGPCAVGIESTIVDLSSGVPRILRLGAISARQIAEVLDEAGCSSEAEVSRNLSVPRVSGSHLAHYAPRTPLRLLPSLDLHSAAQTALQNGQRVAVLAHCQTAPSELPVALQWYTAAHEPVVYAHDLYAMLRWLDASACDLILVETPPDEEGWWAVSDRLQRAACGSGAPMSS